jgi:multidrug efflux pump
MNISAPFIARPVATTLITIGVALAGVLAFRLLPIAPLPQVDFPTISVSAALPGREPRHHGGHRGDPSGARARHHRRRHRDHVALVARLDQRHDPVRPQPQHRRRGARRAGRDQRLAQPAAERLAEQSDVSQGQSGRRAHHDPRAHLGHADARADVRRGVHRAGAAAVAVEGVGAVNVGGGALPAVRVELDPDKLAAKGIALDKVRLA